MDSTKDKGLDFADSSNFHWAGTTYHKLGGTADTYNPRLPVLVGGRKDSKAEDDITWEDHPKWRSLRTRLKSKEQRIDRDTLRSNADMLLRLFEQDVVRHVVKAQADTKTMK